MVPSAIDTAVALKRVRKLVRTDRMRECRELVGLSQSDVARALDVAPSQVSRWERGLARPTPAHALELIHLLDIPVIPAHEGGTMNWKKLLLNVGLAAFWAGLAAWQVSGGEFSQAALVAVAAAAARGAVGYLAGLVNKPVPVDV